MKKLTVILKSGKEIIVCAENLSLQTNEAGDCVFISIEKMQPNKVVYIRPKEIVGVLSEDADE